MANIQEDLQKILSSRYGKDVRQSIHDAISDINDEGIGSRNIANNAKEVAITSRDSAQAYAQSAAQQATASAASASTSAQQATASAASAATASQQATAASQKATAAANSATAAARQATAAAESESNAKIWSDRAVDAAQSMSGGIIPRGSVNFEDLPTIDDSSIGDLYIILDEFTSTTDFEDGGGHDYPAGTKIYLTSSYKWAVEPSSTISATDLLVTMDEL